MTLSQCLDEYIRHRRSLGVCFHGEQVRLSTFLRTVGDREIATVHHRPSGASMGADRSRRRGWPAITR